MKQKIISFKSYFFGQSIDMSNPQQNEISNEIEQIKRKINSLQDRLIETEIRNEIESKEK